MKYCNRCILPENFPGVRFDENGTCNHCLDYKGSDVIDCKKAEYENRFANLITHYKGKSDYDVLMAYSGGKDSTYTLDILKNRYHLNILALTFDNGFISPYARDNITKITEQLGIDHLTYKPRYDILQKCFKAACTEDLFPAKTLERASPICTMCMALVKSIALKLSIEKQIPFIVYGWSPGQAPIESSVMKVNPSFIKKTQQAIFEPLFRISGKDIEPYFLHDAEFSKTEQFPYNIHPLAFLQYNEHTILKDIMALGWISPQDTDSNSTNCLLNAFAVKLHKIKYHFHPYVFEVAGLVRSGAMSRDEGIIKIEKIEDDEMVDYVSKKLEVAHPI
jgi:tRNA(Ile)-lysidine synthase TilS/MesJ